MRLTRGLAATVGQWYFPFIYPMQYRHSGSAGMAIDGDHDKQPDIAVQKRHLRSMGSVQWEGQRLSRRRPFPMDDRELRRLIEQLQTEIQNAQTVDRKDREILSQLESEIRELLARTGGKEAYSRPTTIRRLEDGVSHFEATHPALTNLISRLLDALSNTGI
jgi:hypothetical protein